MGVWFATTCAGGRPVEAAKKPAPLRIAHVVSAAGWGGMEARTLETARWQAANGHDVLVITPEDGETFAEAVRCGLRTVHADFGGADKLGGLLRFRRLLRDQATDVADFHTNRSYAFGVRDLCALVRSRHNLGKKSSKGLKLNKEFPFHHFISTSRAAQDALTRSGAVRLSRSSVVGEWAEDRFFSPVISGPAVQGLRARLGLPTDRPVIGTCAMIRPDNAFDELIRATAALRDRGLPVTCVLVGGPSERRADLSALELELRALAQDLGVQDLVKFLGHRNDVPELLSAMDVVAIVSRHTAQTRVGPEAAARGRPVVGFSVGALGETVREGLTGRLVPPGDLPAFVGALERLLEDQAGRERIARSAELFARQNFRQGLKMEQTLRAYDQARARRRGRPASSPAQLDASPVQAA
jgi:glycosyltransferase involved in cell wall biosynthesis